MKAIVIATGRAGGENPVPDRWLAPMMPLVDRPFIQHVVEYLVERGVNEWDFVLSNRPERIERLLGNGERWGASFRFHLAADPREAWTRLKRIARGGDPNECRLVGRGDRLPAFDTVPATPQISLWHDPASGRLKWTGWATLTAAQIAGMPETRDGTEPGEWLTKSFSATSGIGQAAAMLSAESHRRLLISQKSVLSGEFPGLLITGREIAPQIRVGRNSVVSRHCQLIPPVFIGENCRVESGAIVGPNAVIGPGSVIDQHARISDALVIAHGYVGESLRLKDVVVDGRLLIGAARERVRSLPTVDSLSLASLCHRLEQALSPPIGLLLAIISSPLLALGLLWCLFTRQHPVWQQRQVVALPAPPEKAGWQTFPLRSLGNPAAGISHSPNRTARALRFFLLEFIPQLRNVIDGDLHLFGVRPRTPAEIDRLPGEWRSFCLARPAGWIHPALIDSAIGLATTPRGPSDPQQKEDPLPLDLIRIANREARRYATRR